MAANASDHAGKIGLKPLLESTEYEYDRLMGITVRFAFPVCRRAFAEMIASGGGCVVITLPR